MSRLVRFLGTPAALVAALAVAAARAQDAAAAPPGEAPAAAPAASEMQELRAQLERLQQRVTEQEAENARQRAQLDAGEQELGFTPQLRLYGFADVGLQRVWGGFFDSGLALSDATNFVLGNVNLYIDATPVEDIRMLAEVRFTTFPNGAETLDANTGGTTRHSTEILDHSSSAGGFFYARWGGIVLERAHIDWTSSDALTVRAGYFLTPYGIWNVDHGSPTRIMLRPPFFVSIELFPERQTGLEAFGVFHALPWDFGYHLYVANGRTTSAVDFDDDKAVGGRVFARTRRPFPLQLGASIFKGSTEAVDKALGALPDGTIGILRTETIAYDELAAAGDVSIDVGALRVRAELVADRVEFEPGKHGPALGGVQANRVNFGAYLLAAYRLPWLGLEPLLVLEGLRYPQPYVGEVIVVPGGGFNVYFNPATTLRVQYSYAWPFDLHDTGKDRSGNDLHFLTSRLIVAY